MTTPDEQMVERHTDTGRNKILNRAMTDLDNIINGHDPEIDTSINNSVWDRLDKMAMEIEARAAIAAMPDTKTLEIGDKLADAYASLCEMTGKDFHTHEGSCYQWYRAAKETT